MIIALVVALSFAAGLLSGVISLTLRVGDLESNVRWLLDRAIADDRSLCVVHGGFVGRDCPGCLEDEEAA